MKKIQEITNKIEILLHDKDIINLRKFIATVSPVDVADSIENMEKSLAVKLFRWLSTESAADIFAYIEPNLQEYIIKLFTDDEIELILEELYVDDVVDLIEEMPSNIVRKILHSVNKELRDDINKLLNYADDSAGSIMSVNHLYLKEHLTVRESVEKIRSFQDEIESTDTFFVVDNSKNLIGFIDLKTLMFANDSKKIKDIMDTRYICIKTTKDQEEVAELFKKYDLNVMPVVNEQHRLVGIITIDDIVDVIEEEATEDIQKLAGINPTENDYFRTPVLKMVRSRSGWLLFLMVSATLSQLVITLFMKIYHVSGDDDTNPVTGGLDYVISILLVPLLPVISGTSGNAGSQSSTMIVRALSLKEVKTHEYGRVLWKELRVASIVGFILVLVNFIRMVSIDLITGDHSISIDEWKSISALSVALYSTVVVAKLVGASLPIIAKKIKLDPAIMAAPLLTTLVDALSTAIFFSVALVFYSNYF